MTGPGDAPDGTGGESRPSIPARTRRNTEDLVAAGGAQGRAGADTGANNKN